MNIDYKAAGKMMGSYRRKEKISQKELAKAVGISNNYLSNIENGYTIPLSLIHISEPTRH